ncbi:hypothetical protein BCY86_08805 [Pajaroellobacter abortibovis]|uniref:RNase H type-1 domain-containing protein n=1 Tax=Pajaroellobacter abortibovis TaxID=1882918 RepID=A0A1L6N058_9BACT|nr:hypothetical protein BCY86_08805 [Pajaroellobacter abortibovis]
MASEKRDWIAYTDGACSGNPGPAGSGMVVIDPAGNRYEGYEYLGASTNNIAELTAILLALKWIPLDASYVTLYTDSQYAIGVLTKSWKVKANRLLVQEIKQALAHRTRTRLVYVQSHVGIPLNERADALARTAIQSQRSNPLPLSS